MLARVLTEEKTLQFTAPVAGGHISHGPRFEILRLDDRLTDYQVIITTTGCAKIRGTFFLDSVVPRVFSVRHNHRFTFSRLCCRVFS